MKYILISALVLLTGVGGWYFSQPQTNLAGFGDPFLSIQLALSPSNGNCLTTDGTNNAWGSCGTGGGSGAFASTTPWTKSNLVYVINDSTLGSTATSSLTASSPLALSQPISIIGASASSLTLDTSGTWSGNAATASALAANGANCSAGSAPLGVDQAGAVESCFDVWTEAENTSAGYVASTRTLTVAGTANQLTSSAGAQDLSDNRTWTLSLPNQLIFPANASTTLKFSVLGAGTSTDLQGNTEVWGMLGIGRTATTTIRGDNATSTFAGGGFFNSLRSTLAPTFDSLTSALLITGAGGGLAEYTGTTCTNQFVRSLDALGVATCASINNGDWSGTDLSVANGGTGLSTFGGTNTILYTTAADTIASESAFLYNPTTDLFTTINASTTKLTASNSAWFATTAGNVAIGTTTPQWLTNIFSATAPQLVLSSGAGFAQWAFRNVNGTFYLATTTLAGTATSTPAALTILNSGNPSLGIASSSFNGMVGLGPLVANGSTTVSMGKLQWDGYDAAGARRCVFLNAAGSLTVVAGACTP